MAMSCARFPRAQYFLVGSRCTSPELHRAEALYEIWHEKGRYVVHVSSWYYTQQQRHILQKQVIVDNKQVFRQNGTFFGRFTENPKAGVFFLSFFLSSFLYAKSLSSWLFVYALYQQRLCFKCGDYDAEVRMKKIWQGGFRYTLVVDGKPLVEPL